MLRAMHVMRNYYALRHVRMENRVNIYMRNVYAQLLVLCCAIDSSTVPRGGTKGGAGGALAPPLCTDKGIAPPL